MKKYKIGIVGASGFTGSELVRLLLHHPAVEIAAITSETHQGKAFSELHPAFHSLVDQTLISAEQLPEHLDLVFLALPHGVSMDYVKRWSERSFKMIDLSGDFRLSSPEVYQQWYSKEHHYAQAFEQAVYGLPELNANAIKSANLVANPGCYPTASILALAPLLAKQYVKPDQIIIDAKSGVSGAGVKAKASNHFAQVNDNFKAYGIKTHRHSIEIEEQLSLLGGNHCPVQFTPHLLPVDRGILCTAYARPQAPTSEKEVLALYTDFYGGKSFVRLRNTPPSLKEVRSSNFCDIYLSYDERTNNIIVVSAIDNLMKGAAGQAVQNMNIMLNLQESAGLQQVPLSP